MEAAAPPLTTHSKISKQTIESAVNALLKWKSSESKTLKPQLLSSDEFLYLVVTLNKIPQKGRTNPFKIPLSTPLFSPLSDSSEFCLFLDDRFLSSQSAKQKILEEQIPVSKVIKLSKLKSDYKPFEAKRKLCDSYDLFFADKRIIPLLPKLIGGQFYKKKKIPVPIELGRKNWKQQIERACASAMVFLNTGTCSVIKIARASMGKEEIVENVVSAINGVAEIVPKKWKNVRSIHLKFSESLALPIYQSVPEMKMKIGGVIEPINDDSSGALLENNKDGENEKKKIVIKKKKGRIHEVRYMDENVGEDESGSDEEGDLMEDERSKNDEVGNNNIVVKTKKKINGDKLVKKVAKVNTGDKGSKKKKKGDKGLKKKTTEKKSKKRKMAV